MPAKEPLACNFSLGTFCAVGCLLRGYSLFWKPAAAVNARGLTTITWCKECIQYSFLQLWMMGCYYQL